MKHLKITHYIRWLVGLAAVLVMGSACTHIKPVPVSEGSSSYTLNCPWKPLAADDSKTPSYNVSGKATWYGREFHRRRTSSGERFNMYGYTAAHRTLPFGTRVLVTNVATGKSVVVRVNDRGPRSRRWVIDLSYAAAKKIGMRGCMDVEIERISGPAVSMKGRGSDRRPDSLDDQAVYSLQAGSFQSREKAESFLARLGAEFDAVRLVAEKGLYKVRVGSFEDPHLAKTMKSDLENRGYTVFTVKQTPDAMALMDSKTMVSGADE